MDNQRKRLSSMRVVLRPADRPVCDANKEYSPMVTRDAHRMLGISPQQELER